MKCFTRVPLLLAFLTCFVTTSTNANQPNDRTMALSYDGFFDRMDDLDAPEYHGIKLAFYLRTENGASCDVRSVSLKTKLKSIEVYLLQDGELLLPFDAKFDQDKAAIVIEKNSNEACGLDMRLESTQLFNESVPIATALHLIKTFDLAFSDLGGMMSFMLPKVKGITFLSEQDQPLYLLDSSVGKCSENSCTVMTDVLASYGKALVFNRPPKKSVAFIQ